MAEVRYQVRQRGHRPLPRPRSLEPAPIPPEVPGRRTRIVLGDPLATLPVFYGDLPTDTSPAPSDVPSAGGCAAAGVNAYAPALAAASKAKPTRYLVRWPA